MVLMSDDKGMKALWEDFKEEIKYKNRYFAGMKVIEILEKFDNRTTRKMKPSEGTITFFRARIGDYTKKSDEEMLAPPQGQASAGRCNAECVSYLYLASDVETAINEVKPNKGDIVTVAEIKVKGVEIFKFHMYTNPDLMRGIPGALKNMDEDLLELIKVIDADLKSVITQKQRTEYIPYQWIAEYIKSKGISMFGYSSTVGSGQNYVLFDWESKAEVMKTKLKEIKDVKYIYEDYYENNML